MMRYGIFPRDHIRFTTKSERVRCNYRCRL
jgi:hypothetical protein